MIILVNPEIVFDRIQHLFLIKTLSKLKIENFNLIKDIYKQSSANIVFVGDRMNVSLL